MILCDVNVLLYAMRRDAERHEEYNAWVVQRLSGHEAFGVSDLVLSGVIRIATNPRAFRRPVSPAQAFQFAEEIRSAPSVVPVAPGPRHWDIFRELCEKGKAKGNIVPDAYFAALALESGCEWITTDRDYARFPGLRWRHPLD